MCVLQRIMKSRNLPLLRTLLQRGWAHEPKTASGVLFAQVEATLHRAVDPESATTLLDYKFLFVLYLLCLPKFRHAVQMRSSSCRFEFFYNHAMKLMDSFVTGSATQLVDVDLSEMFRCKSSNLSRVYSKSVIILELMRFAMIV